MNRYNEDNSYTRLGSIYHNMKTRCTNPNYDKYQYYGGKGIKICDEWMNSWDMFCKWAENNGYDDTLTLDRIDPNGDYCPSNCRWVSRKEQANNRSSNHMITYNGKTQSVQKWADETGIPRSCLDQRILAGWNVDKIFAEPIHDTHTPLLITFNGKTQRLHEWAKELGIKYKVLHNRIAYRNWSVEKALTTPVVGRA